jgi:polysaccharide biosynthesis/export protein
VDRYACATGRVAGDEALNRRDQYDGGKTMIQAKTVIAGFAAMLLAACAFTPGGFLDTSNLRQIPSTAAEAPTLDVQPIDSQYFTRVVYADKAPTVCPLTCTAKPYEYTIGISDVLQVVVWDHPELTPQGLGTSGAVPLPSGLAGGTGSGVGGAGGAAGTGGAAGGGAGGATAGAGAVATMGGNGQIGGLDVRVSPDGTIFFPRVGRVHVAGETVEQVQKTLTDGLKHSIVNPQLDVRVSGFNSKQIEMVGDVRSPQAIALTDIPLHIIDAINRAGGAPSDADLQNVGVTRDGVRHRIDVAALLESGDIQQNVVLLNGDIVDVPDHTESRIFVLGEIVHPQIVPMNRGRLTLADALTSSGSIDTHTANPHFIYVIRGLARKQGVDQMVKAKYTQPEIFSLDMTRADALMLMTQFQLKPLDVVYVQIAQSARFNRLLDLITPSLQTLFFTDQLVR